MLWGLLSFKQHLLFGRSKSKPPGSRSQAESASVGFGGGHARANPQEAEIRPKVLRRGLAVDMPQQTPGKQKSAWFLLPPPNPAEALSARFPGFALACPPPNPAEALSAWFLLPGGLLWHVHRQTPPKHFRPDFCFPGVCSGMSTAKSRRSTFEPDFCFPGVCSGMSTAKPRLISASRGFALACPPPNPAEALSAWFLLPGGLLWHVHRQTPPKHFRPDFCFLGVCSGMSTAPRRSTFGLISASRGFALACPPPNPAEALSAWFLLPGGLLWHVHRQTPLKHFRPDFCFPGVCCGIFIRAARRCGRWFPERDCILEH